MSKNFRKTHKAANGIQLTTHFTTFLQGSLQYRSWKIQIEDYLNFSKNFQQLLFNIWVELYLALLFRKRYSLF